jgi:hypothetical protein
LIVDGGQLESRSIFISSCSRRQLARRRSNRSPIRAQLLFAALLVSVAIVTIVAARGWI